MKKFLNNIRSAENPIPLNKQIINTICILFIGIILGIFSKFLDTMPTNELPFIFEFLDMRNFLGRFAMGMVTSYYLYSKFVAGFFSRSYAMIWVTFTVISPILAFICWYARGKSKLAFMLSATILAVLFNTTFVHVGSYFEMRSILELITFLFAVVFLKRKAIKDTMIMLALSVGIAFVLDFVVPFDFG